ncbi:hypothetical protein [Nostocoides vanveenii]|uniref:Restriction endonuclease n=1 Tax=Nostocoides vanveenii TaxID=330835 RepID=A0ABN2KR11_9MICO
MARWQPLQLGSTLNSAPSAPEPAPVIGKLESLPFNELPWEDFERLQWRVMRDVKGLRHAQLYGERGQAQKGLDIVALAPDGTGVALQSKKYRSFGASNIRAAVSKFLSTSRPFTVETFIIGVARPVKATAAVEELAVQRRVLRPTTLELWDAQELSHLLRGRPDIVIEYFGMPTAEAFCLPFKLDTPLVPAADAVAVREALSRTPEVATGAQQLFDQAAATRDPSQALEFVEAGQVKLRDAGFGPHAAQHDSDRYRLLAAVGREGEAARHALEQFWTALDQGLSTTAQLTQSQLAELAKLAAANDATGAASSSSVGEQVTLCQRVAEAATALYLNPLAQLPAIETLRVGEPLDQIRLLLLAGEAALANNSHAWLTDAVPALTELAGVSSADPVLRTRLRLLLAETTGDWADLLADVRQVKLGYALLGLVTARYARDLALHERFTEADLAWDEASAAASLARQWGEASTWVLSRRAFRSRWNPFTSNDLLPMQTALREMGTSTPLISSADHAYQDALTSLSDQKLRSAAISAQRALRDAVTTSDWAGEDRARRVLAAILIESDEPLLAAHQLTRAGATKAIEALGASQPHDFIRIVDDLDESNYWTVGTAYRLLAAQADLIPDDLIGIITIHLIGELTAAETGSKPDLRSFATSRYNNAIRLLAGIADRLQCSAADEVLDHFEKQPPVEANHYRYHDEDEAITVAKIASTHTQLTTRAITHLVALLGRSESARTSTTIDAIEKNYPFAYDELAALASTGNRWAQEMLAFHDADEVDSSTASEALTRLTTTIDHVDGVYSVGTGAVGDSLLIRHLPASDVDAAVTELLLRADDPHIGSSDRGDYLVAAANLAPHVTSKKRADFFTTAVRLATSPTPSDHDQLNEQFAHKLGAFRMNGTRRDSRGQATALAAALATDEAQRSEARRLAYGLIGTDSDYWPTRALQHLGDTLNDDLTFLASQGWAIRSLAAILWAKHGSPAHVGARLAADPDVRVRRALARALAQESGQTHPTLRKQLALDPAYSVRSVLQEAPGAPSVEPEV